MGCIAERIGHRSTQMNADSEKILSVFIVFIRGQFGFSAACQACPSGPEIA
jgi:hypothetical protein